jgi:hypothetical protein
MLVATTGLQRAWDVMAVKRSGDQTGLEEAPHYHGHRERLRARFREAGSDAVTDYELLESWCCSARCRGATSSPSPNP